MKTSVAFGSCLVILVCLSICSLGQTPTQEYYATVPLPNQNFVKTEELVSSTAAISTNIVIEKKMVMEYFDGLGMPLQTVHVKGSPDYSDLITPREMDRFGREARRYLPYPSPGNNGLYDPQAIFRQSQFYYPNSTAVYIDGVKTDQMPYSSDVYERSPLNRILQSGSAGSAWQPDENDPTAVDNHATKVEFRTNADGTEPGEEQIIIWNSLTEPPTNAGYYISGSLSVRIFYDAENKQVREYSDKPGRVILKKVQRVESDPATNNDDHWAMTYYIYGISGNLLFVFPPELSSRMINR